MPRRFLFFVTALLFAVPFWSQTIPIPSKLDDLSRRAEDFRHLLASGDRAKAAQYVATSKRNDFINNPVTALQSPRIVGIDFVGKDRVHVRVSGQAVVATGSGAQVQQPVLTDLWVWEKNAWYFDPETSGAPAPIFTSDPGSDAASLAEIKSSFKLVSDVIDVGELLQGDHKRVPVKFEYTGSTGIRVGSKLETPLTLIDGAGTFVFTKESKEFTVIVGSDDFEGAFEAPVIFSIYYKAVALDQTVKIRGNITPLFKFRQIPDTVAPDNKEEFQLLVTNNTDLPADIGAIFDDAKFYISNFPHHLAPREEGIIKLKRNINATAPGTKITLSLQPQLKGKTIFDIRIH